MIWLTGHEYIKEYKIKIRFNDGTEKIVDLKDKVFNDHRTVFKALQDINLFKKVRFNPEADTIEWPNGADLAPEFLYDYPHSSHLN